MKNRWGFFAIAALLLLGCSESSETDGSKENPKQDDPPKQESTCKDMSCVAGCCNGECVDFRTDPNHCGRCETQCDKGQFCQEGQCSKTCIGDSARICGGICVNIATNEMHCGGCDSPCANNMVCSAQGCVCDDGYMDCDGNAANGCESYTDSCTCTPGETRECYPYTQGTPGKGICQYGRQTCVSDASGIHFSECVGAVGPIFKATDGNPLDLSLDNNCNGIVDANEDLDNDGYTRGQGDCCDSVESCNVKIDCPANMQCYISPDDLANIHPGAYDDPTDHIDNNCDGILDDGSGTPATTYQSCSENAKLFDGQLTPNDALLLAQAMDICDGLISAELLQADGSPLPKTGNATICGKNPVISPAEQVRVSESLGGIVKPVDFQVENVTNRTMAILSSGKAEGNSNKAESDCVGTEVNAPKVFLDAHSGVLPSSTVCDVQRQDTRANDSIMLRLKLKAPEYARGFSFQFKFFSKEYPSDVCGNFNDFFLALVDSPTNTAIPADHNVAFDQNKDPVSVNNAFFTECDKNACKKAKGCSSCEGGTSLLKGYFDATKSGATGWLKTSVPVSPNEEFTLDLVIFDAGEKSGTTTNGYGHLKDSLVLLDAFAWSTSTTKLITYPIIN